MSSLTSRERDVVQLMKNGHRLLPIRYSRLYGLYPPGHKFGKNPKETVQQRIVDSLKTKGVIKIGIVGSTTEYVLAEERKG